MACKPFSGKCLDVVAKQEPALAEKREAAVLQGVCNTGGSVFLLGALVSGLRFVPFPFAYTPRHWVLGLEIYTDLTAVTRL